jgi:hypothetical protein
MPKKRWSTRLAPGRDHSGTAGEIKSERAGEIKSVHLGDIVGIRMQRIAGAVIPEIGIGGHTYRKSLFALTLDPDNQHFAASLPPVPM